MTHELKCWPPQFVAVQAGRKTFEFRKNDRDFQRGDALRLREWDPGMTWVSPDERYTGYVQTVTITYIIHGPAFGIPEGYCVMSIERAA